jgi:hypothetical protein
MGRFGSPLFAVNSIAHTIDPIWIWIRFGCGPSARVRCLIRTNEVIESSFGFSNWESLRRSHQFLRMPLSFSEICEKFLRSTQFPFFHRKNFQNLDCLTHFTHDRECEDGNSTQQFSGVCNVKDKVPFFFMNKRRLFVWKWDLIFICYTSLWTDEFVMKGDTHNNHCHSVISNGVGISQFQFNQWMHSMTIS